MVNVKLPLAAPVMWRVGTPLPYDLRLRSHEGTLVDPRKLVRSLKPLPLRAAPGVSTHTVS